MDSFWSSTASSLLHWYKNDEETWLTYSRNDTWVGWTMELQTTTLKEEWCPWTYTRLEENNVVHWFQGGFTNACFNEIDRMILKREKETNAFLLELSEEATKTTKNMLLNELAFHCVHIQVCLRLQIESSL